MISRLLGGRDVGHGVAKKTDNLELTDKQKTRLLSLALESERSVPLDQDEEKGDLLCDILRCPLPVAGCPNDAVNGAPRRPQSVCGPSLDELLSEPETSLTTLKRIKKYAKTLGRSASSEAEKEVFLAVYFGAIARALTSHGERITDHSGVDLVQFLNAYAHTEWMRVDLRELFAKAAADCQSKGQERAHPGC